MDLTLALRIQGSAIERHQAARYHRDPDDRAVRGIIGRADGGGYGRLCRRQQEFSRQISSLEERSVEP